MQLVVEEDRGLFEAAMASARTSETGTCEVRVRLLDHADERVTLLVAHSPPAAVLVGSELLIAVPDIGDPGTPAGQVVS